MGKNCTGNSKKTQQGNADGLDMLAKQKKIKSMIESGTVGPRIETQATQGTQGATDENDLQQNTAIYKFKGVLIDERDWDFHFERWRHAPDKFQRPGPHPNPDHSWNTHPEMYGFGQQ